MTKAKIEVTYNTLVVGCGSRGLAALAKIIPHEATEITPENTMAIEGSSRIGGTHFLISRLANSTVGTEVFEIARTLPALKIWWERNWLSPNEVDWDSKEWAYVLPQWKTFFQPVVERKVKAETLEKVKSFVMLEKPVSEISHDGALWNVRSGEKTFKARRLQWTLGLKSLQNAYGKKEAEEFMEKNPDFQESAREAEGAMVATYTLPEPATPTETQFVGIPVRHDGKFYLTFVSLHENQVECFTFLHQDLLKFPKELSSFEKSIRRTLKHTLANYITELTNPTIGVFDEAKGYTMASPWRLKDNPEKGISFIVENSSPLAEATTPEAAL